MDALHKLNTVMLEIEPSPIRAFSRLAAETPDSVRLTLGEPYMDTPEPIRRACAEALESGETHYIDNAGSMALREAIAAFENRTNARRIGPEHVLVTDGATEGLFIALFSVLNPGDEVIVPIPAFVLYERILQLLRAKFIPLPIGETGFQIDEHELYAHITPKTRAILINSPNNPTGCALNRESLDIVARAAKKHDLFVIADDVYRALSYHGALPSIAEYPHIQEKTLIVQSFSKPYAMTGWRMGYLLGEPALIQRMTLLHQFMVTSTPAPFQRAAIAALQVDTTPMLEEYRTRRDLTMQRLREMRLSCPEPDGAFYAFPDIGEFDMSSTEFATRLLRECGVAVTPGIAFGADSHIRISYSCGMEELQKGLDRLERFVLALRGGRA